MRMRGIAALVVLVLTTGTGCGQPVPEPAVTSSAGLTAPDALQRGGLTMPTDAVNITLKVVGDVSTTGLVEHYRVTFEASDASAKALCVDAGMGAPVPIRALSQADRKRLGVEEVPAQALHCSGQDPQNTAWQRDVLIKPGDPAQVWVSVGRMGR